MKKAQTVSREKDLQVSLDYEGLRAMALRKAQEFSGNNWTDYNYHDPGVTLMEQLCYAITDLGYRTRFPMTDLLFPKQDQSSREADNLLYYPEELFPVAPLRMNDFRRLFLGQLPDIRNVWVNPIRDDAAGYQGLLEVLVQAGKDLDQSGRDLLSSRIAEVFHANRPIGYDLGRVIIMKGVKISLRGRLQIDPDVVGELLLAQIFARVNDFLNPAIRFRHPDELLEEGMDTQEIFQGPSTVAGHIPEQDLSPVLSGIYLSRIQELIAEVAGVKTIEECYLMRDEVRIHDNLITFEPDEFPYLDNNLDQDSGGGNQIVLLKNQIRYQTDSQTSQQFFNAQVAESLQAYRTSKPATRPRMQGRFTKEEIQHYFSLQHELPEIYGLKENSLPADATPERKAQALQLKAFLTVFEQIMADFLAQLANTRRLFSIASGLEQTYFTQIPADIPQLDKVVFQENKEAYGQVLERIHREMDPFVDRRNRMLDHLMARFGETFPAELLRKFGNLRGFTTREETENQVIQAKIRFLEKMLPLGYGRGQGYHIRMPAWDTNNISIIAQKLNLLLDMRNSGTSSLIRPLLLDAQVRQGSEAMQAWDIAQLTAEKGEKVEVMRLKDGSYEELRVTFYAGDRRLIHDLFLHGSSPSSYRILRSGQEHESYRYHLVYQSPQAGKAIVIYESLDEGICQERWQQTMTRFTSLNFQCEGFHLLEHLLLRPRESVMYTIHFFDDQGSIYLRGGSSDNPGKLRNLVEDLPFLGVKKEQYGIEETEDGSQVRLVLYDGRHEEVGRFDKTFYSRYVAEKEIDAAIQYFQELMEGRRDIEASHELVQLSSPAALFPIAFEFSHAVSLVLPDWPARFQNEDFRFLLRELLAELLPAHFHFHLHFVGVEEMSHFEGVYQKWLEQMQLTPLDHAALDVLSLQLVQLLLAYGN